MRANINSYVEDFARRGEETAYASRRGLRQARWSYARVARAAYSFARELEARGVGRGERVLLWAANGPEWVAAFLGCSLAGVVVVPLDVESAPDFVARVGEQTTPRLILLDAETAERGRGLADVPSLLLEGLEETTARHSAEAFAREVAPDDLLEIIFTSGTTAEPRGVLLSHRNFLANLGPLEEEINRYIKWERPFHPIRFLNLVPLSHVFGQFMGIFVPQLLGGEVHFQNSLNPSEMVETIRRERVSVVVAVPRMLESLREHVERHEAARGRGDAFARALEGAKGAHPLRKWWTFRRVHRRFGLKFWAFVTGGATLPEE
ncbi:MAG TPA: AMP-binding protein, partial [Pyrinomonadaceae bacterium]